jgi:hypothetical protein
MMAWSDAARAAALEARRQHMKGKHAASNVAIKKHINLLMEVKGSPSVYERKVARARLGLVHAVSRETGRGKTVVAKKMFHGQHYATLVHQAGRK